MKKENHEMKGSYDIFYGKYRIKRKEDKSIKTDETSSFDYKGKYNRLFPNKVSSTAFVTICTLRSINSRDKTYGLQIIDDIVNMNRPTDAPIWKPAHSMLYGIIGRLKNEECIVEVEEDDLKSNIITTDKRQRKYYSITEKGKERLKELTQQYEEVLFSTSYFFNKLINELYPEEAYKNMVINIIKQL